MAQRRQRRFGRAGLAGVVLCASWWLEPRAVLARGAAAVTGSVAPPAVTPAAPTAGELLRVADDALERRDRAGAQAAFERLQHDYPASPEAAEAHRALRVLALPASAAPIPGAPAPPAGPAPPGDVVIRNEPYSLRTSERLRLTTWEKLDFGVTSFIYGVSLGASFAIATRSDSASAVVVGALGYTVAAVAFLGAASPDRGDLPLALGIVSYVPMTTLLVSTAAFPTASSTHQAEAVLVSSLLAMPAAVVAARHLDLDPGDTQLVRDAAFWGLVLSVTGTLAIGTHHAAGFDDVETGPSNRTVALAGLAGLYGGLGLGVLAAANTEMSLERIRVTTWGGYGGGLLGALVGLSSSHSSESGLWSGLAIGSLIGLTITLATTSGLDGIPPETTNVASAPPRWSPLVTSSTGLTGPRTPLFGIGGTL